MFFKASRLYGVELKKNRKKEMESDLQRHHHNVNDTQAQLPPNPMNSGLTRYRSAPSSYFASIIDTEFCDQFFNRPPSPETEQIFARFMTSGGAGGGRNDVLPEVVAKEGNAQQSQFMQSINNEAARVLQQQSNYSSPSQTFYQSPSRLPLPNQGPTSVGMDQLPPMKTGGVGHNSSLLRQSSSPAGFLAHLNVENSYAAIRGIGHLGAGERNKEASRLKNYSTGPPSAVAMSPIAEMEDKNMIASNPETAGFREDRGDNFVGGFPPMGSWDDAAMLSDNITGLKRLIDDDEEEDEKPLSKVNLSNTQNMESVGRPPLAHHLSLPKTAAEMAAIEKFLHLQDSVPCKIRAKRGCATHPRSIAERVRRTRISERMRKLQDLVPNMDKQTNTADMLDLAVDYIKELQDQVQKLSDNRARCTCSNKQQP